MMASGAEQEEVYTLLLTNIPVDSMLKDYYHANLLRTEIGKVISVHLDDSKASAIVKVKVKRATAANLLEEVQGNLKQRDRSENVHFLCSESSTVTLNWNPSMKTLAIGMIEYARKHYPMMNVRHVEGIQVTISGMAHDVIALQEQYNHHVVKNIQSFMPQPVSESTLDPVAVHVDSTVLDPLAVDSTAFETNSTRKEYPNLNPDVLALLQKMPEGKIPGLHYNIKRGCVVVDNCSSEEEGMRISTFQTKYHEVASSRKLKVDALEIPEKLSDQTVRETISLYDAKYSHCVFITQEDPRAVRVISNSSRQFEQAKKMLKDDLNQASVNETISATLLTSSESMVIPLAGGRKLTLKQADIVLEEVDIIVNAANRNLDHGAGVAGALNRASNGAIQKYSERYIKSNGQLFPGQVTITRAGGSLKCKRIIHSVGPMKFDHNLTVCEQLLHDVMNKTLQEAEKFGAQSIAIPAISSGIFGVSKELVARCVTDSIRSYKFHKPLPTLSDIRIVIIDHPTYSVFVQYFATVMAVLAQSNPDPHKSATHPLSSSPSIATMSSNPTHSTNAAVSLPKEAPKVVPSDNTSMACASEFTSKGVASGVSVGPSSSAMNVTDNENLPAEKTGAPLKSIDVTTVTQILMPIADRWYALGLELGFSAAEMDKMNSASSTLPGAQITVIVREGVKRCGDLANFVNILTTALQSSRIDANEVATTLTNIVTDIQYMLTESKDAKPLSFGSDAPILRPILRQLADKWRILGFLLGFDHDILFQISNVAGNNESFLERLVTKWLCGDSSQPPTLEGLIAALQNAELGEAKIAAKLLEVYGMNHSKAAAVSDHPTIKDVNVILHYLAPICQKWRLLGILLGMNDEELTKLQGEPIARLGAVISSWLAGKCLKPPTLESLTGALRSRSIRGDSVAATIEQQLLKKVSEEGLAVGGDASRIHYPPLPSSDDEDIDENRKSITPPPGFDTNHGGTSIPPPLLRSLSDPHTSPLSSLVTGGKSHDKESSNVHAAGSHVHAAATSDQAVKGRLAATFNLTADEGQRLLGNQQGSSSHRRRTSGSNKSHANSDHSKAQPSTAANFAKPKRDKCVICLDDFKDPVRTRCNHIFCRECIDKALAASPYCPICKVALRTIVGNQPPNGRMTTEIQKGSLPGYEGYRTIKITYYIPDGTQGQNHPKPGRRYTGTTRCAYLPDTPEGQEVLMLLRKAFDVRLTFTVGRSVTTGTENTVVWNDIHHKTSPRGGTYGYPDPTYLQRVKEDLAAKGIVLGPEDIAV